MYGMDPHDEIAYWRSRAQKAELELRSYRETEGTNAICFDKVVAERDALSRELERWRHGNTIELEAVNLRAEVDRLNKYIATHDEEYATMKETLRAEHQECQRLRADLAAALKAKDEACEIANRLVVSDPLDDTCVVCQEQIVEGHECRVLRRLAALHSIGKGGDRG